MNDEPKYTWHAVGVNGHSEAFGSDFLYTSNDAPVEADEYERMKQRAERAEAAEARVRELEAQIAGLLPAAQALVTSIEFIPIPASNAAADSALLTGTGETSGGNVHGPVKSAMLP